jgi:hypothetical protein
LRVGSKDVRLRAENRGNQQDEEFHVRNVIADSRPSLAERPHMRGGGAGQAFQTVAAFQHRYHAASP